MSEYEKLKWICDEIGYEINVCEFQDGDIIITSGHDRRADVREIIFTQEFMDKLKEYIHTINPRYSTNELYNDLMDNLDSPAGEIYSLFN